MTISATILLKGKPKHLVTVLSALKDFDEVLIYDNGADEESALLCSAFQNVRVMKGPFLGFGRTHNAASGMAKNDWIFSVDSDEVPSKELLEEIKSLKLDPTCVYSIPRKNYYNGKWIRGCGWNPDIVFRLYFKKATRFSDALVHESLETRGLNIISLHNPLIHYSYDSASDFLTKMQSYTDLFAKDNEGKKSSSPLKAISHGIGAFLKSYLLKRGFLDGHEGFFISLYNAQTAYYKYIKLYESNLRILQCPEEKGNVETSANFAKK